MTSPTPEQNSSNATNITNVGSITGQVHTGSGNINVGAFYAEGKEVISTKDEFLAALQKFIMELEASRLQGLSEEHIDDTTLEIAAAEKEATKDAPKPERILNRLENAKAILTTSAGVTTAATTIASQLLPIIENIIHSVSRIFMGI